MDENKIGDFKKELKALLDKHNAVIGFNVSACSDTFGLHDERMEVDIDRYPHVICDGWSISSSDL